MGKKTYYIAVGSGDILENKTDSPYEFEIEATDQDIDELKALFDDRHKADWGTFVRSHIPVKPYHLDKENDEYDANLYEIYRKIYELGSEETKIEMEKLGIFR